MQASLLMQPIRSLLGLLRYINIFGYRGFYYAIYCLFSRKSRLARVSSRWSRSPVYLRLNTSDINVFRQVFIDREYAVANRISTDLTTILDAGANIGLTAIFLAQTFPSATIYSLEPEMANLALLKRNTQAYTNIQTIHGALWNKDEPVEIDSLQVESWAFRVRSSSSDSPTQLVPGYRLGSLLRKLGMDHLDLLKLDIEGAEFEVLQDQSDWIHRVGNIVAEIHEAMRPGTNDLFLNVTQSFGNTVPCGELILASREPLRRIGQKPSTNS